MARKPKNIKQKQYCNKFNEDFKNGQHKKKNCEKKKKGVETINIHLLLHRMGFPGGLVVKFCLSMWKTQKT